MWQCVFLGTGASTGVPSFYCNCPACKEARTNPRLVRTCSSVLIQGKQNVLVDAPPDLRTQLIREDISDVHAFFLTHTHYDHTGGLGELEFYVRLKSQQSLPAYFSKDTANWVKTTYGFMADCFDIHSIMNSDQVEIDELYYQPLTVRHAPGTYGLLITTPNGTRLAYIPDSGPLPQETQEKLKKVDYLVLDATFWGRNWMSDDHHSVDEAIQTGMSLEAQSVYLTHLSMHYDTPITDQELNAYIKQHGEHLHLAYDGLKIDFQ